MWDFPKVSVQSFLRYVYEEEVGRTSAASAALLLASSELCPPSAAAPPPPSVRPGPLLTLALAGMEEDLGPPAGGAPTVRPGEEKFSDSDLPQMLPIARDTVAVDTNIYCCHV